MVGNMGILERDYDRPCCKLSRKRSGTRVASSRLSGGQFRDYDIIILMIFSNNQTLYTMLQVHVHQQNSDADLWSLTVAKVDLIMVVCIVVSWLGLISGKP